MAMPIDGHDVRVGQVALNENFSSDLVLHLRSESLLGDDFQAAYEVSGHMLDKVHLAVAAFIDKPDDAEDLLPTIELQPYVTAYRRGCSLWGTFRP